MAAERQLLAKFETVAQFNKVQHQPCRFRTALCPDRCGHGKDWADFKVVAYLVYNKPGEYGDGKDGSFHWDIKGGQGEGPAKAQQEQLSAKVGKLKAGDYVKLNWLHEYVKTEGAQFPERPITLLEPITADEANRLAATASS
mmetsp:Transcript_4810/g.11798  ORF Transcript_4810/g.11798 Transcript_4810/m.11798 type:complete len:142 (-) Transcript_4810:254-679(-)|eukprot:CAMPEP_0202859006 /NCGR_PEP_ID=MMETSP1391-20130828/1309_1 /ASSEMBLY_ACC=CAM_ASM_000867 /TAXON_ID=1034604 /ORGANISM="Chlamydomonas leiostraca, Strain SAG 11-49" /LENGTH=141 /DNA_ID=CAMNT_0049538003 /DNA_START=1060 /DNA_END=1485 /DNA_ORIENTATION=-